MTTRLVPNPLAIAALVAGEDMQEMLESKAEEVAEQAKSDAPVRTGAYRESIEAVSGTDDGQAIGRVNANVKYAGQREFGGLHNQPARHILANAAEKVGLTIKPDKT